MVQVSGVCLHVGVENGRVVGKVSLELVRKKKKATMRVVEREVGDRGGGAAKEGEVVGVERGEVGEDIEEGEEE